MSENVAAGTPEKARTPRKIARKIIISILLLLAAFGFLYKTAGTSIVDGKMQAYLEQKGYLENEISKVKVRHSFLNRLLSYSEWSITVEYTDEPGVTYHYAYKDNEITSAGVSGEVKSKEDLLHKD